MPGGRRRRRLPGIEIGEEAFVAAGAVVAANVAARSVVLGVPARATRAVPDEDLLERWLSRASSLFAQTQAFAVPCR